MKFKDITLADVSVETKIETLGIALDSKLETLESCVSSVEKQVGPKGDKGDRGDKGDTGVAGKDGKDGKDGLPGKDGKDGVDGLDGDNGVGVADVEVDLDGRLLVTLTDGSIRKSSKEVVGPQGPRGIPGADGGSGSGGGAVDSVNGQTGTVVLVPADIGAEVADATILKDADIGVTVQGYNSNIVIDSSYTHTDNNYTTAEKSKLAGIAAGAEVNVNADWNATTGDAQILNKPTLFDPANPGNIGTTTHANGTFTDVTVTGNLSVSGTITTVNTADLNVSDNLIYMANNNSSDVVDVGFAGAYNPGTGHKHTGLVRDASDGKWKLFSNIATEPSTTVDFTSATFDTLRIGALETSGTQVTNWDTAYGWGNHASAGYLNSSAIGSTVQANLVSATNIKTINGSSILGSGDLVVSGGGGSFTGGTLTSPIILAAGTSTNATEPLKMQSGTVTATPAAGTFEYDGVTVFATPQAGNRGVIPTVHYITQVSAYTTPLGTANTLKQMFNVTTNGALTVAGNTTYFFDCLFYVTAMSATAGTLQFGIGGTATFTNILYTAIANKTATGVQTASSHTLGTAKTAVVITASNTTTTGYARIQGKFIVSTGGTIIPSFALSIAAAAAVQPGSYFKCWEAGNNTEVEIGAWT